MALTVHLTVVVDGLDQEDAPAFVKHVSDLYTGLHVWLNDDDWVSGTVTSITALDLPLVQAESDSATA
jgi:hypothetical protein